MNPRAFGMMFTVISVALLIVSFSIQTIQMLGITISPAVVSILFLIPAVACFQYADKTDRRYQGRFNYLVGKHVDDLTSAIDSDLKREDRIKSELEGKISSLANDVKEKQALSSDLKKHIARQEKAHESFAQKQKKINAETKKKVNTLASDVKRIKGKPGKAKAE